MFETPFHYRISPTILRPYMVWVEKVTDHRADCLFQDVIRSSNKEERNQEPRSSCEGRESKVSNITFITLQMGSLGVQTQSEWMSNASSDSLQTWNKQVNTSSSEDFYHLVIVSTKCGWAQIYFRWEKSTNSGYCKIETRCFLRIFKHSIVNRAIEPPKL